MSARLDRVADYYRRVDACDFDVVAAMFAPDARYDRAGAHYEGLGNIDRFFRTERKIRGEHRIEAIWSAGHGEVVVVLGAFIGVGEKSDPRQAAFADVWRFDTAEMVCERRTFLALGHDYIER